ncbi:MAG: major facilitator superfamily domain-containing protein [Monoraphidium minutum]|nr:MAG: major facilitator superfamily domain-containing protein [Monoraphidium minutum]
MGAADDAGDAEAATALIYRKPDGEDPGGAPLSAADSLAMETACVRKLNRNVLSILFAVAMMCYIDRTNLAFASVNMTADLGFNPQVYGLGSGLFFLGYSVAMVPAQIVLLRIGAPRALAAIVAAWGLVAMAFSTLEGERQFYFLRLLLGAFESGAFPAMWYYINSWYPSNHITLSYSVIEAAVGAANCLAAPLAAALLLTDGFMGLRGWQVLFFVEGLPSVLLGVTIWHTLPRYIHDARFLAPAERAWLAAAAAGPRKHAEQAEALGTRRLLGEALSNRRLWLIIITGMMRNAALNGVLFFAPKLVDAILTGSAIQIARTHSAGSTRGLLGIGPAAPASAGVRAALLTSVPFVLSAGASLLLAKRVQERGERCRHMSVLWFCSAGLFSLFSAAAGHSPQAAFACLSAAVVAATAPNALLNTLAAAASQGPAQAVSLSFYNAVANVGGLVGPLFIGFVVHRTGVYTVAMFGLGMLLAVSASLAWFMQRWGLDRVER